jgi:predicted molibdopterin-dependent oxidoreductase YjgC
MARVRPNRANDIRFESAAAIRAEIARAVPLYAGIETLRQKGDQVQWGGPVLYADGRFATSDGLAHFAPVRAGRAAPAAGELRVSTRRGKQFNSMIQHEVDPLTGARRDDVFISATDAKRLGLQDGASVRLRSASGTYDGRVRIAAMHPGNLEVHWPEGNALLAGLAIDPDSMEPDYNATVTVERRGDASADSIGPPDSGSGTTA